MIKTSASRLEISEEVSRKLIGKRDLDSLKLALLDLSSIEELQQDIMQILAEFDRTAMGFSDFPIQKELSPNPSRLTPRTQYSHEKIPFPRTATTNKNWWGSRDHHEFYECLMSTSLEKLIRDHFLGLATLHMRPDSPSSQEAEIEISLDSQLVEALERAEWVQHLFCSVAFATQKQACKFLGKSSSNPSSTLLRLEAKRAILRFDKEGRPAYPVFQFDIDRQRVHPVISDLIETAEENKWPEILLLEWLVLDNGNFECRPPFEFLGSYPDYVSKIFKTVSSPPDFG